ncbi:MAG: heavy metal-binding domain-containing protein [Candidatus Omnitrophota bacterium]
MLDLIFLVIMIGVGYFAGTRVEKKHYKSIEEREAKFIYLPAVSSKNLLEDRPIDSTLLVQGNAVIATDYFKVILAGLRNLLGGEVSAYESLLDRARREAVLRLKESAQGADIILNLRIETCQISTAGSTEALAYGTAVYYKK